MAAQNNSKMGKLMLAFGAVALAQLVALAYSAKG